MLAELAHTANTRTKINASRAKRVKPGFTQLAVFRGQGIALLYQNSAPLQTQRCGLLVLDLSSTTMKFQKAFLQLAS